MRVVGGPTLVDGTVVVLDVTASHDMDLTALSPVTGRVLWSRPSSPSDITLGVAYPPVAVGTVVLNLAPAGPPSDSDVILEGILASTGTVVWRAPAPELVVGAPMICGRGTDFCVTGAVQLRPFLTSLSIIDAASGLVVHTVVGPEREMSIARPGTPPAGALWQTSEDADTFQQVSANGRVLWVKAIVGIFGGLEYDPDYGWMFYTEDGLDVGSLGYGPSGNQTPLGDYETVGISVATGGAKWTVPGNYDCGGVLQFLTTDVVCDYSGSILWSTPSKFTFSGVGLTVKGLDVRAGRVTWGLKVLHGSQFWLGARATFLDGSHLVVETTDGKWVVLDTANGATRPVAAHQIVWCEETSTYDLAESEDSVFDPGKRVAQSIFTGCTVDGTNTAAVPPTRPADVGVNADGLFIWATPQGIRAVPTTS
jgi:hypothetical protein